MQAALVYRNALRRRRIHRVALGSIRRSSATLHHALIVQRRIQRNYNCTLNGQGL